jgi:serine/threonine protein kinase
MSEIEALHQLKHPCITKVKGFCLPSELEGPSIVMEFVGGGTLKDVLRNKPRWWTDTRKAINIVQIVLGMEFIHSKKFIHRDLKPTNILLDDDHSVKISDFGSSRMYESEVDVTMTGVGTPLYMAPEVASGHYDQKVDVYSFGLILYDIVSGTGVFSGDGNKMALHYDMVKGKRPDIPATVLPFTRDLIKKCWSESATERPSFSEIWKMIQEVNFRVVPGVESALVKGFVSAIEELLQR